MRVICGALLTVALVAMAAACGGDDDNSDTSAASGAALSDEEYLKTLCTGVQQYSTALATKTTAEELTEVLKGWAEDLSTVNPPADLVEWQGQFVDYLEAAYEDPTRIITQPEPSPPQGAVDRLGPKESDVPECENIHIFSSEPG